MSGISRALLTGLSVIALLFLWRRRSARQKLVYVPWWYSRKMRSIKNIKLGDIETAKAVIDAVERCVLPLTCSGVLSGEPISGACILLARTGEVISAASSQESSCALHNAEMLALEEASLALKALRLNLSDDCVIVSTHRASLWAPPLSGCPYARKSYQ